ncbi:ABC transporter substrate binding protein [Alteromonas sp. 38]|uniref:ABC transporter substrate-binding protein n=1 Tax=Alteromonas TaxID=226 RepID=UPI0012F10222|nr:MULTISPECIES: ABC transporter substrate binding protein [Alteromonas]CAD5248513.1 ABC transporter substrate binding protein [Alteromonas sp. 154]VXC50833.1 ABC transporter substrate binding protein [Alteromonas sp. 38]
MKKTSLLIVSILLCFVFHAQVNAKPLRVVIIETGPLPVVINTKDAFIDELTLVMPDHEIDVEIYNAEGLEEKARSIVETITEQAAPDLLVPIATLATRAVYNFSAAAEIPTLFMTVADPVKEGIVTAFGEHSTSNITGESHVLDAKVKLDMLDGLLKASALEEPITIGLVHSEYPSSKSSVESLLALESQYDNVKFVTVSTAYVEGTLGLGAMRAGIVEVLKEKVETSGLDAYWLSTGPLLQADDLINVIYKETKLLPIFAESIESVQQGALLGVVADEKSIGKSGALRAKRILSGERANTMAVTRMDKYTIGVNVSTAIKMHIPIPSTYLKLSKEHVYQ